ncbi:MAG: hypothetical protein GX797_07595 [Chloroflexi bacterium]|jgi:septum formation inhibitor MinC|nr:hypothetical protein [Chloroflexota bacterium]
MATSDLLVRGIHGGVLITLPDLPWHQQRDLLVTRIQTQERFFKGGRIALDVGETNWTEDQLYKLLRDLSDEGVCLWTILTKSVQTLSAAEFHGFPTSLPDPNRKNKVETSIDDDGRSAFASLGRSLEPGEKFEHNGNLLIIGDVPLKATLSVSGNLVVWGETAGEISAGTAGKPAFIRLLNYDDANITLQGKPVEIPAKQRKNCAFEIKLEGEEVVVKSHKPGRLKLL